jgi:hypothetical protein
LDGVHDDLRFGPARVRGGITLGYRAKLTVAGKNLSDGHYSDRLGEGSQRDPADFTSLPPPRWFETAVTRRANAEQDGQSTLITLHNSDSEEWAEMAVRTASSGRN